jgi:hypothetical protein
MDDLPHMIMTFVLDCNPSSLDNIIDPEDGSWYPKEAYIDQYAPYQLTRYSNNNLVVDATAVAGNNQQIQQKNKYQCGHRRKRMITQ